MQTWRSLSETISRIESATDKTSDEPTHSFEEAPVAPLRSVDSLTSRRLSKRTGGNPVFSALSYRGSDVVTQQS